MSDLEQSATTDEVSAGRPEGESLHRRESNWRSFLTIWFGQTVSGVGTTATYYGLGIWVYLDTDSTAALSVVLFASLFPQIAVMPLAGSLIDRLDRRRLMIVADSGAAAATGVLAFLFFTEQLTVVNMGIAVALGSLFQGFQNPAFSAATTTLISKENRGRAAGLFQVGRAVPTVVGPITAGAVMAWVGVGGILAIDFATFVVAIGTLLFARIPAVERTSAGQSGSGGVLSDTRTAARYIWRKRGLAYLIGLAATVNVMLAFFNIYMFPILLGIGDERTVGVIAGVAAMGMVAGAILMSVWGGPARRMPLIYGASAAIAAVAVVFSIAQEVFLLGAALAAGYFFLALGNSSTQPILQSKVEEDLQGRVFALRQFAALSTMPVAYAIAGPLADRVLAPKVAPGSDSWIASVVGTGDGRAAAAGLALVAVTTLLAVAASVFIPTLRNVEVAIDDVA